LRSRSDGLTGLRWQRVPIRATLESGAPIWSDAGAAISRCPVLLGAAFVGAMIRLPLLLLLLVAIALSGAVGCASGQRAAATANRPSGPVASKVPVVIGTPEETRKFLQDSLGIRDLRTEYRNPTTEPASLMLSAELVNLLESETIRLQVSTVFDAGDGKPLATSPWTTIELPPRAHYFYVATSINPAVAVAQLQVRVVDPKSAEVEPSAP
jgi:hypothetical protein